MVAALMKLKNVSAVVVGADRVASNGDTANKIGTYQVKIKNKFKKNFLYVCILNVILIISDCSLSQIS